MGHRQKLQCKAILKPRFCKSSDCTSQLKNKNGKKKICVIPQISQKSSSDKFINQRILAIASCGLLDPSIYLFLTSWLSKRNPNRTSIIRLVCHSHIPVIQDAGISCHCNSQPPEATVMTGVQAAKQPQYCCCSCWI